MARCMQAASSSRTAGCRQSEARALEAPHSKQRIGIAVSMAVINWRHSHNSLWAEQAEAAMQRGGREVDRFCKRRLQHRVHSNWYKSKLAIACKRKVACVQSALLRNIVKVFVALGTSGCSRRRDDWRVRDAAVCVCAREPIETITAPADNWRKRYTLACLQAGSVESITRARARLN